MLRSETSTEFENSATRCSAGQSLAHVVFEKPKKQKKKQLTNIFNKSPLVACLKSNLKC